MRVPRFTRPEGFAAAWQLDLGRVAASARVRLNGRELAVLTQNSTTST